ncbi:linear amide C-N hydrolase [Oceanobacillus sp. 143]|uniref:Acyl-CoA--6-aminopenicillanic acid acyltransferase n=1 Tax=Oceanobacillus zhaokaii TaxID=2052660 RepID=A0A345PEZ3_9BACI|nr:C45 family peptidase [Oceanobacillus zhaokaii]AXI08573.1 acyl-CoA--6-aminopenicillanic acid acyltransferase [Oceanobacillus zhaokaii]QGS68376.1 linear amide C-N hydrolase [Oceanobacillus sp. 143]
MKRIYSDIIQFRGSHYDFGFMQGEQLRDSLTTLNRERIWKLRKPKFSVDENETKNALMKFAPGMWEEIQGMKDALKMPMQDILRDFGGYRIAIERSGCSIFTGKDFLVRNYDFHPKTYEGRFSIFQPTDTGFASIGPAQRITGRMDGMNEKGLAMGYNAIHRKKPGDGFVCWMIGRMILENCANVEEVKALLNEIPHRHSFSYIVLDPNGETYIIETSPRLVSVRKSNACTNHFEDMTDENRRHLDDSHKRLNAILEQKDGATDAYTAFRMMNDTDKGVFSKEYKSWAGTIHTSVYLPKERQAWIALGGDQEPVKFDFATWIQGKDIQEKRIYGEVDTNLGFAHMDHEVR